MISNKNDFLKITCSKKEIRTGGLFGNATDSGATCCGTGC